MNIHESHDQSSLIHFPLCVKPATLKRNKCLPHLIWKGFIINILWRFPYIILIKMTVAIKHKASFWVTDGFTWCNITKWKKKLICMTFLSLLSLSFPMLFWLPDRKCVYYYNRGQTTKNKVNILEWFWSQTSCFSSHVKAVTKSAYYHLKNIAIIRSFVSSQDLEKLVHAFVGWIIVMVSSPAFQRRPLDSCSSSRTLLPGSWLQPENMSISHQSSGPYTGFQLHLRLILKYFYLFINHSIA